MSTKTTFKRIALVVVAALGLSLVAVAPSNAAANAILTYAVGDGAPAGDLNTGNGIAGPANTVTLSYTGSATLQGYVTVAGASATIASGGTIASTGTATLIAAAAGTTPVIVRTPVVGTITASVYRETGTGSGIFSTTAAETVTITVNAAAVSGLVSATLSTEATSAAGTLTGVVNADGSITGSKAFGQRIATSTVTLTTAVGTVATTQAVSVVVSGVGYVVVSGGSSVTGKNVTTTRGGSTVTVDIYGDGNPGVSTVTFTAGGYTFSKSVTFYGSLAKLVATTKKVVNADTATAQPLSLSVIGYDAAGVVVPSQGLTITSGTPTVFASYPVNSAATAASAAAQGPTSIAAKYGSVVLTIADTATGLVTTTATVIASSATPSKVKVAFNGGDYAPGAPVTVTVSATDANNLPLPDGVAVSALFTTLPTANTALQGLPVAAVDFGTLASGSKSYTAYAPFVGGTLTVAGVDINGVATSATAEVTNLSAAAIDAAAEATDAANAATDAANAAAEAADAATAAAQDAADAVAALSTQVAEMITALKKQITALTNLVIKIQKKVKA